jgi:hypothetical protein
MGKSLPGRSYSRPKAANIDLGIPGLGTGSFQGAADLLHHLTRPFHPLVKAVGNLAHFQARQAQSL